MRADDDSKQRAARRCSRCGSVDGTAYGKDNGGKLLLCRDCLAAAIETARWKIRWAHRIFGGILVMGVLLGLYAYQVLQSREPIEFTPSEAFLIAVLESVVAAYSFWSMYWGVPPAWRLWRDLPGRVPFFGWFPWWVQLLVTFYVPLAFGTAYGFFGGSFYEYAKCRKMATMIWREGSSEIE